MITTVPTLVPNDVTRAKWQHIKLGYFGFISVELEEVEPYQPSLHTCVYKKLKVNSKAVRIVIIVVILTV